MAPDLKSTLSAGSLNRAATLLRAIACGPREGSALSELVKRTGLPRPTVYRVMDALIALDWVTRNTRTSRFNLGKDLTAIGFSAVARYPLERLAAPVLGALAEELGQTNYLDVRSGFDMVCIGRYESASPIQIGQGWVGMRGPLGMTPGGMAILARLPRPEARSIIEANMPRYRRIPGFEEQGFRRSLKRSLAAGHGTYDAVVLDRTMGGLGVAVCDPAQDPIASIGATYVKDWLTEQEFGRALALLKKAAADLSSLLFSKAPR